MPGLRLDQASLTLPGRPSPFSLAGMLPVGRASAPREVLATISLDVSDGERIALLGGPGSGRSSLLRLLAARRTPTAGACRVDGSVVAILDVGSDLDPEATGQQDLERLAGGRADGATELSGLSELLDVPVGFCSPGMRWRLGFAAAAVRTGEVLLVDECLREADLAFPPRALAQLHRLMDRARVAVVAEPALFARCSRAVELVGGRLRALRRLEAA